MAVTLAEISEFLVRLRDEPPGEDFSERVGRKHWYLFHNAADGYPCPPCRPTFQGLVNVDHNTVNVKLDKPVVNPKLYERGIETIMEAYQEYRHRGPSHTVRDHGSAGRVSHVVHSAIGKIEH